MEFNAFDSIKIGLASHGLSAELAIKFFPERDGAAVPDMTGKCGNAAKGTG